MKRIVLLVALAGGIVGVVLGFVPVLNNQTTDCGSAFLPQAIDKRPPSQSRALKGLADRGLIDTARYDLNDNGVLDSVEESCQDAQENKRTLALLVIGGSVAFGAIGSLLVKEPAEQTPSEQTLEAGPD